jgi:tetratricopeptide (TPR) repeat protein
MIASSPLHLSVQQREPTLPNLTPVHLTFALALELFPAAYEELLKAAEAALASGQSDQALEAAEAAAQLRPPETAPYLLRAQAFTALRQYSSAVAAADEALQRSSTCTTALLWKAQALIEGQIDLDQGKSVLNLYLERTQRAHPVIQPTREDDGNAHQFLAFYHYLLGDEDEAVKQVDQALSLGLSGSKDYPEAPALQFKGELLQGRGDTIEAADCLYEAGRRFIWRGEYEAASEQLQRAVTLNSSRPEIYWYWAEALRMRSYLTSAPYADKQIIEQSLRVWDHGTEIALPNAEQSFAYSTRAFIAEQLAGFPSSDRKSLWWQAATYMERALLLSDSAAYDWACVGRYHRFLNNDANAEYASARAIELNGENQSALEERVAVLANMRNACAEQAVDKLRKVAPSPWADGVKAVVLMQKRQYPEALRLISGAIKSEPENIWNRDLRAQCYRLAGNSALAASDYSWILQRYNRIDVSNQDAFGRAAYCLGEIEEAKRIFAALRADFADSAIAHWYLGSCDLTQGDLASAEENLGQSIALARTSRELRDLLEDDLEALRNASLNWSHGSQVREIVDRFALRMRMRIFEIESPNIATVSDRGAVRSKRCTRRSSISPKDTAGWWTSTWRNFSIE